MPSVFVVELGEPGRRLRMVHHAISLARADFHVQLLYSGSICDLENDLKSEKQINIRRLLSLPNIFYWCLPRFISCLLKLILDTISLLFHLPKISGPDFLVVQNPPSLPALPLCYLYTCFHPSTELIIDWHNYDWSMLATTLGARHPWVLFVKFLEDSIGRRVQKAFCVSKAMKKDLEDRLGIFATVLYDRPSNNFRPISLSEQHSLFNMVFADSDVGNIFTSVSSDGVVTLRPDRPGLLVSSTSWTEEEDFSVLFDALSSYEEACNAGRRSLPDLVCIISGKGPLRDYYCDLISDTNWSHVTIYTVWLEPEDYPKLLASADLGVSLHASPNGFDLPMKVVDMFACGLPVAAKSCPALHELVINGINGMIFDAADELANQISAWFQDFPSVHYERRRRPFFTILDKFRSDSWPRHWESVALPVFESYASNKQ